MNRKMGFLPGVALGIMLHFLWSTISMDVSNLTKLQRSYNTYTAPVTAPISLPESEPPAATTPKEDEQVPIPAVVSVVAQAQAPKEEENILTTSKSDQVEIDEKVLPANEQHTSVCSVLRSFPSTSTMAIWREHLNNKTNDEHDKKTVKWASKHRLDKNYKLHDFTFKLLHYMTPQRLQTSIKAIPFKQQSKINTILNLAYERHTYVQKKKKGHKFPADYIIPRKVRILVLGGSVTEGIMCKNNPVDHKIDGLRRVLCAWPAQLMGLLNYFFEDVFTAQSITLGGTNTRIGTDLWKYSLFPSDEHPDIVFNSYSTNDMHVTTIKEANMTQSSSLDEYVLEMYEDFIRVVLQPRTSCNHRDPPLLFILDDYIGNEQRIIKQTRTVSHALHDLSTYYGFGFISYADAVRDFVYGDTNEWWFSPTEWPKRQIHPGYSAHLTMMWVVAFNLLNTVSTHCDQLEMNHGTFDEGNEHVYDPSVFGMEALVLNTTTLDGEPLPRPKTALPPKFTTASLDTISEQWQAAENDTVALGFNVSECTDPTGMNDGIKPCPISWVYHKLETEINAILEPFMMINNGWEQEHVNLRKTGLIPNKVNATMKMKIDIKSMETRSIKVLNIMFMKSYGEKWASSRIKVGVWIKRNGKEEGKHQELEIVGFHGKHTSEVFNEQVALKFGDDDDGDEGFLLLEGDELYVTIDLVGGTMFKIMGMMFCQF